MFKFKKGQILASERYKYKLQIIGHLGIQYYKYRRLHPDPDLSVSTSDTKEYIELHYFLYNPSSTIWREING